MKFSVTLLFLIVFQSFGQLSIDSLGHFNFQQAHQTLLNDIWGYTDDSGNEYALVGARDGFSVVDVSQPDNPSEVFWYGGTNSVWRDVKTWGDYFYVSTEAEDGVVIVDGTGLPANTALDTVHFYGDGAIRFQSAHNLWIDSTGILYVFGANYQDGGVLMYDLISDPMAPQFLASIQGRYTHDGYVFNQLLYNAHTDEGEFSVYDVSVPNNPTLLVNEPTLNALTHNTWATEDGNYLFVTDENSSGYISAYDVSDLNEIELVDTYRKHPELGVIPHNVHVRGDYMITSYYSAGVVIHDVSHPYNMIEIGQYATYPQLTPDFDGCWGVFPFFDSGIIVASDITGGLFVLGPNYQPAAYLEGIVTNSSNNALLQNVSVQSDSFTTEFSNDQGFYAAGNPNTSSVEVTFFKHGFASRTETVQINQGQITTLNIALDPLVGFNHQFQISDIEGAVSGAQLLVFNEFDTLSGVTNGLGQEDFTIYYPGTYKVYVSKWGNREYCGEIEISSTGQTALNLLKGYQDGFMMDQGWTEFGTVTQGDFVREVPFQFGFYVNPTSDVITDCGNKAFITGNHPVFGGYDDDVDSGLVTLTSPVFDVSQMTQPTLSFDYWFFNDFGNGPANDTVYVSVSDGLNSVDVLIDNGRTDLSWNAVVVGLDTLNLNLAQLRLRVTVVEAMPQHVTEFSFDNFKVFELAELTVHNLESSQLQMTNPFDNKVDLTSDKVLDLQVYSILGKLVCEQRITTGENSINTSDWPSGTYLFLIDGKAHKMIKW